MPGELRVARCLRGACIGAPQIRVSAAKRPEVEGWERFEGSGLNVFIIKNFKKPLDRCGTMIKVEGSVSGRYLPAVLSRRYPPA